MIGPPTRTAEEVPRDYVAPISFGLGDLVVSLPIVQAMVADSRRRGRETWLVARSTSQALLSERIPGLGGWVDEATFRPVPGTDRVVDLRDHPLQRDYWWGSPEFEAAHGRLDINEILGRIASDFGIDADLSGPTPLQSSPVPGLGQTVLLVTETDGPAKAWPASKWEVLAGQLRRRFEVRQVTRTLAGGNLDPLAAPALALSSPGAAVDALSSCRGVIGIDTGLTHIAVQQRTATVTICRHGSVYFRPWPHARALRGAPCGAECLAEERASAYNDRVSLRGFRWRPRTCPSGQRCLAELQPGQAARLFEELV
jgi:Glycosyltransferase family 9 (heptosyltransferase)